MLTKVLLTVFAAACGGVALWHELQWRKRIGRWTKTRGTVVGTEDSPKHETPRPVIEYRRHGVVHQFVSGYGESGAYLLKGRTVTVYFDPHSAAAEYRSGTTRWLFTIVPGIFCAGALWIAWFTDAAKAG